MISKSQIESEAHDVLKSYWGYDSFRSKQLDIIVSACSGEDVLAIMPTGGGKSICFQVPAMMMPGTALVVTPLIALMKDQVQNLSDRGIKALCINATMNRREINLAMNNALYGDYKFLYVSPERLSTKIFQALVRELDINFIVVDEAHCISQWGYDFRPDYLAIGKIRELSDAPIIALTATATPSVAEDITQKLEFKQKNIIKTGFERPNLSYIVRHCEDKLGQLSNICSKTPGSGIVYVRSRKRAEELSAFLKSQGISSSFYHAGLGYDTRTKRQEQWKSDKIRVMVCTNAFGMGIDKPDVRFVVHFDVPDSPEAYFQEAGRGGRDGKRSYAVTLWNSSDIRRLKQVASASFPSLNYIEDIYHKVHAFFHIPYDLGKGSQLKFNIYDFCKKYSLARASVFYAVKYLGQVGHWSFMEDIDIQTRVMITVDRNELYDYDFSNPKSVQLLEFLMRRYTGIWTYPVSLDETYVSEAIGVNIPVLRQLLYYLSLDRVIRYIPADKATVIYLQHDRLRPKNVNLKPDTYNFLKDSYNRRMEEMLDYIQETDCCRSSFLLKYFGQEDSEDCGTCDICRDRRKSSQQKNSLMKKVQTYIQQKGESWNLSDVVAEYSSVSSDNTPQEVIQAVRTLIDNKLIIPSKSWNP